MTRIELVNRTDRPQIAPIARFLDGRTLDEFFVLMAAAQDPEAAHEPFPKWLYFASGAVAPPGGSASVTVFLSPGTYTMISFGDEQGPFVARGMPKNIMVAAPEPAADVRVEAKDFEFAVTGSFGRGPQTVRLQNVGRQPHEALLVSLQPGVPLEALLGPPPADAPAGPPPVAAGIMPINPDSTGFFTVDLRPGRYVIVRFLPDHEGPHVKQGMFHDFHVE